MDTALKICVVSSGFPSDHKPIVAPFLLDLFSKISALGHTVVVVTRSPSGRFETDTLRRITIYRLPVFRLLDLSIVRYIIKLHRKFRFDIIHGQWAGIAGFSSTIAGKLLGIPVVLTIHGAGVIVNPELNYGLGRSSLGKLYVTGALRMADTIVSVSKHLRNLAVHNWNASPKKIVVVPNFVDINRFNPNLQSKQVRKKLKFSDSPIILTVRNLNPKDGVQYLIESIPEILKQFGNVNVIIVGEGYARRRLEELARKLKIQDHVCFTGWVSDFELPYYYALCNVFVIPSLEEGFGISSIEAMACGKPVVGTNVGGIPEVVLNRTTGLLVKAKDSIALARGINQILSNSDEANLMGREGRKRVEQLFTAKQVIPRILTVYNSLRKVI